MRLTIAVLFVALGMSQASYAQEIVGRGIIDGRTVELLADKTWRFEDEVTEVGCQSIHSRVQFCGPTAVWQKTTPPNADVVAAFRHDDRHYAQFIVETIGTNDGMSQEIMRNAVVQNAAAGTGQNPEDIVVVNVSDTEIDGEAGETIVYQFGIDGLQVVFANTVVVMDDLTIQAMTYAIAPSYAETQQNLTSDLISAVKIN